MPRYVLVSWVVAVTVFATVVTIGPVVDGIWETILALAATLIYVAVASCTLYELRPQDPQEKPSAVRARYEAAVRRKTQG